MATLLPQIGLTYDDVTICPQYSTVQSRSDVDTSVTIAPGITLRVPLIAANMETVISEELCVKLSEYGGIAMIHQFQSIEREVEMLVRVKARRALVGASIGCTGDFMERAEALVRNHADIILMDTPHGHSKNMLDGIHAFRKEFPHIPLMAGTVATRAGVVDLVNAGVDAIKFGVGAGAACTTRMSAGVGIPQFSALMNAMDGIKGTHSTIIADAGVKYPGQFAKAIGTGAAAIKVGKIFAGTDESNAELIVRDGVKYKVYRGEASMAAKQARLQHDPKYTKSATQYVEGADGLTNYEGSLESLVNRFSMGLRSAMSYTGAFTIKEFQEKVIFMQVTQSGQVESNPHGLVANVVIW